MDLVSSLTSAARASDGAPAPRGAALVAAIRAEGHRTLVDRLRRLARTRAFEPACVWLADDERGSQTVTYAELDARARAVGATLEGLGLRGGRALLVFSPGLEFVGAFLGCLYAGVVAVPLAVPRTEAAARARLGLLRHAAAGILLGDEVALTRPALGPWLAEAPQPIVSARLPLARGQGWRPPALAPEELAFLQYTSGSTGEPKGVEVRHGNLLCDEEMIAAAFGHDERTVFVGWLPHFHDMGLVGNVLQPLYLGGRSVLMSPASFVQKPVRWLRAITRHGGTTAGAPDFAYEACAKKVRDEELAGLDLSSWRVAYNGSEPVRAETLERFADRFASCGFRREAFYPCYGLAEATLFVSGGLPEAPPAMLDVRAEALARDRVEPVPPGEPGARRLSSCGRAWLDQEILVVEASTRRRLAEGRVGEIWLRGGNIARGYRGPSPRAEDDAFSARLSTGEGPFLRTGDLGFLHEGELYVTGRADDLLILRGRNHYPQDLERTASESHPALRVGAAVAFCVEERGEVRLVLALELAREVDARSGEARARGGPAPEEAVRAAIARAHDLQVWRVVLLAHGALPRTTSGKLQRRETRSLFLRGELGEVLRPPSAKAPPPSFHGPDPQPLL